MKRGMNSSLHRERVKRELESGGPDGKGDAVYKENNKELEGTNVGNTGAWDYAANITGKGVKNCKDIQRMADYAYRYDKPGRQWFKETVEDPLYRSKDEYARATKSQLDRLYKTVVKNLDIKKGSKESAAVQMYGEGVAIKKVNGKPEKVPYTIDNLKKDFNYKALNGKMMWENIIQADKTSKAPEWN